MKRTLPFLLMAGLAAGCDAAGPDGGRIVAGVDLDRLFARPTPAEVAAVAADWAARDVSVKAYTVEDEVAVTLGDREATLRIVSHAVDGHRHYGGVIVPKGAAPGSLPVLVYLHGGDRGVSLDGEVLLGLRAVGAFAGQFVIVVPSFRSEPLRLGTRSYRSEGAPSPWDRDVDDALALLNAALAHTPEADEKRIGLLGFSRGAAVGLLMGARDPRIDALVEFYGPTDFFGTFAQQVVEDMLQGGSRDLPGVNYLNEAFIQPLKRGEVTLDAVRRELVRRSAVYFADRLPQLQVHHGTGDPVVPVSEAQALDAAMRALGRTAPGYEYYLYDGGTHFPLSLMGSFERTVAFLGRLIQDAAPRSRAA